VIAAQAFDALLAGALVLTGGLLLASTSFMRAAVLFIAFGLLMSIAWVRLMAPDIALAEAAIGAGVTGVLLIDALRHMEWDAERWLRRQPGPQHEPLPEPPPSAAARAVPAGAAILVLGLLLAAVYHLTADDPGLARAVQAELVAVEHPVTAVLLVFRGFDTMLELGILALAVLGMLTVRSRPDLAAAALAPPHDPVLAHVVRLLVPLAALVAGYLLWLGTFAAGGAFQSGVVLGAAGILLWLSRHGSIDVTPGWLWRGLVLLGFAAFLVATGVTLVWTGRALEFPPAYVYALVQIVEAAAALSVGASFAALFVGLHPGESPGSGDGARE
jgi:multisubunit Na+/H+ antiporter MnhB subunit